MNVTDFMPGDEVVAGIKADLEPYEAERARRTGAVTWRVPVFLGRAAGVTVVLAFAFNGFADPNEQWFSSPHVFLYFGAFVAGVLRLRRRDASGDEAAAVVPRARCFRWSSASSRTCATATPQRRTPSTGCRARRPALQPAELRRCHRRHATRIFPSSSTRPICSQKAGKSDCTVFKGVVVAFETITPFPGMLVAVRKAGPGREVLPRHVRHRARDLECGVASDRRGLRIPHRQHRRGTAAGHRAAGAGAEMARRNMAGQPAKVALSGRDGFLLLPLAKNFFELPGISMQLDYKAHVEPMVADMVALLATAALVRKIGRPDDVGERR